MLMRLGFGTACSPARAGETIPPLCLSKQREKRGDSVYDTYVILEYTYGDGAGSNSSNIVDTRCCLRE